MNPGDDPRIGEFIPGSQVPPRQGWRGFNTRIIRVPTASALGFGSMLAITLRYVNNHSIGWAIVHGLLSWLFVIYAALFY
jgi:hypothetical protein